MNPKNKDWQATAAGIAGGAFMWIADALNAGQAVTLRGVLSFLGVSLLGYFAGGRQPKQS